MTAGPIPSADELMRYGQVQADLPERIMRQFELRTEMAIGQNEHRIRQEDRVVGNNILMERLGWVTSTVLGLGVLGGSMGLIYEGKSLEGFAGVILGLATLVGLFLAARQKQVQELSKKRAVDMLRGGITSDQLELLPGVETEDA